MIIAADDDDDDLRHDHRNHHPGESLRVDFGGGQYDNCS